MTSPPVAAGGPGDGRVTSLDETGMQVGAAPPAPEHGDDPAPSRRRPLLVVGVLAVVLAVTGIAVTRFERPPAVLDAAGRSLPHRPATAPVERWRVPVGDAVLPVEGTGMHPVVVQRSTTGGHVRLRGRDPRDGKVAWTRELAVGEVVALVGDDGPPLAVEPVPAAGPTSWSVADEGG